jgi:hypothetical protein
MAWFPRRRVGLALSGALVAVASLGLAGPANATITDPPGYYHFTSVVPGTCIDARSAPPGTPIVMWRCLNTDFEEWRTTYADLPPSQYDHCHCTQARMFNNRATNLCMAVASNADPSRIDVLQQTCDPSDPKQWWIRSGYYTTLQSFSDMKYLRAPGDKFDNGVTLEVSATPNQSTWTIPDFA